MALTGGEVVVAVLLVIAEGFDPGEVLQALTFSILHRLIHAEIVGVAVDVSDRLLESDNLLA
jgi:hypothetical protein